MRQFNRNKRNKHDRWQAQLSAYVDDQLAPREQQAFEAHLRGCEACQAEIEEMRSLVTLLRSVPQMQAPRSFTLTEAPARKPGWMLRYTTPLRYSTALAAALLAVVVVGDFVTRNPTALVGPSTPSVETQKSAAGAGLENNDLGTLELAAPATAPTPGEGGQPPATVFAEEAPVEGQAQEETGKAIPESQALLQPEEPQREPDSALFLLAEAILGIILVALVAFVLVQWRTRRQLKLD